MTQFAIQLNDPYEEELRAYLPQTDTRLRPDVRALENGDVELAGENLSDIDCITSEKLNREYVGVQERKRVV